MSVTPQFLPIPEKELAEVRKEEAYFKQTGRNRFSAIVLERKGSEVLYGKDIVIADHLTGKHCAIHVRDNERLEFLLPLIRTMFNRLLNPKI